MQSGWPLPEGIKTVEVNGYPIAYCESGSGIPLILVHGSLNDYRYWNSEIGVFAEQYRVIAVSLRHYFPEPWDGHGDTPMTLLSLRKSLTSGLFTYSATRAEVRSRSTSLPVTLRW